MKIKRKIKYCMIFSLLMILVTNCAYARVRYATGVGTTAFQFTSDDHVITTTDIVDDAVSYFEDAGYTEAYPLKDPSYTLFASNMIGAEVIQLFSHGGYSSMPFKSYVGITTGATRTLGSYQYIGLDYLKDAWKDNLLLIAYMGCQTALPKDAENLEDQYKDTITYQSVAYANAETAIGFEEKVSCADVKKWSELFNEYLASGHGVEESALYANNNISGYNNANIKKWLLVYNTNPNQKIGRYHSTAELSSIQESYTRRVYQSNNLLNNEVKLAFNNDKEIIDKLRKLDSSIEFNNYVVTRSKAHIINASGEKESREIEFVDVNLKIGDFYTDAGYTLEIENNNIKGIYDRNIDIEKQKELLNNEENFQAELYVDKVNEIQKENEKISTYNLNKVDAKENDARYYYDIKNNKKYYQVEVENETLDIDGNVCTMYDVINYEL